MQKEKIYNLQRFIDAHDNNYEIALLEIKIGSSK